MRKMFLLAIVLLASTIPARAEIVLGDLLKKIPAVKQGIAYSVNDARFNYMATVDVLKYRGTNLEVGYAGRAKETADKAVAVLSYDLVNLKSLGVNVPILDLVSLRPGVYAGIGRIEGFEDGQLKSEADWGVSVSIIDVKF